MSKEYTQDEVDEIVRQTKVDGLKLVVASLERALDNDSVKELLMAIKTSLYVFDTKGARTKEEAQRIAKEEFGLDVLKD